MKYFLPALLLCIAGLCTRAQDIVLNAGFGNNGLIVKSPEKKGNVAWEFAETIFELPDGKLLIAVRSNGNMYLIRYLPEGTIDKSYGKEGLSEPLRLDAFRVVRTPDGNILVAGVTYTTERIFVLYRFNENGQLDTSFGNNGVKMIPREKDDNQFTAMTLQSDGKILLLGYLTIGGTQQKSFLLRLLPDGTPDPSFANNGRRSIDVPGVGSAKALAINGSKILVGATSFYGQGNDFALAQFTEDGTPDAGFAKEGVAIIDLSPGDQVHALTVQDDGKILLAGSTGSLTWAKENFTILRFLPYGKLDDSFQQGGISTVDFGDYNTPVSIKTDGFGRITVVGHLYDNGPAIAAARLRSDGTLDSGFGDDGRKVLRFGQNEAVPSDGLLTKNGAFIGVGHYIETTNPKANFDYMLVQLDSKGQPAVNFGKNGLLTGYIPLKTAGLWEQKIQPDGKIIVRYSAQGETEVNGYFRFLSDGTIDQSFGEQGFLQTEAFHLNLLPDNRIITFENIRGINNANTLIMRRYSKDGKPDHLFGEKGEKVLSFRKDNFLSSFTVLPDGKLLLVAHYVGSNWWTQSFMVRLDADGNVDKQFGSEGEVSFVTGTSDIAERVVIQPDGKILAKGFYFTPNNSFQFFMRRFTKEGQLDESFGTKGSVFANYGVYSGTGTMALQPDGKILLGAVYNIDYTKNDLLLQRYNQDGTLDVNFGKNGGVEVPNTSFVLLKNGKILINTGVLEQGKREAAMMLLNPDGSIDENFGNKGTKVFSILGGNGGLSDLIEFDNKLYGSGTRNDGVDREAMLVSFLIQHPVNEEKSITGLFLVNATSNKDVQELKNGDVIDLSSLSNAKLNIRADAVATVGSVIFSLKGPHSHAQTESLLPYALFGDDMKGKYYGNFLPAGDYTLTITPYKGAKGSGEKGTPLTINFKVVYSATVSNFTLVNADTDKDLMPLKDGDTIDLAALPSMNLNIRANAVPGVVGSMAFELSGAQVRKQIENSAPYALFVNNKGDYYPWTPQPGSYTLTATPHSATSGGGEKGAAQTIHFNVVYQPVQSFTLVNASTGKDIQELKQGAVINLSMLPGIPLNIRANTGSAKVGSVLFELQGATTHKQTESLLPYALFGDDMKGKYYGWTPEIGSYQLTATAFTNQQGSGVKGQGYNISFKVVNKVQSTCPEPSFAPVVSTWSSVGAYQNCSADFNNDGRPDMAVLEYYGFHAGVLLGNGNGSFREATPCATGGRYPQALTTGDFNGDGNADLVIANEYNNDFSSSGIVNIMLGKGDGSFAEPITHVTGVINTILKAADFNGDGKLDLALTNNIPNTFSILPGRGDGSFGTLMTYSSGGYFPRSMVLGDFNGDGNKDLAIGFDNAISVIQGRNDGTFAEAVTYRSGGSLFAWLAVADINSDAKQDLVFTDYISGELGFLFGKGDGTFNTVVRYPTNSGDGVSSIAADDFNGDDIPDIAVGNVHTNSVSLLVGRGDGSFATPVAFPAGFRHGIIAIDFNQDGKKDLAFSSMIYGVGVMLNTCSNAALTTITRNEHRLLGGAISNAGVSLLASPNPFSSQTTIRFLVPATGQAVLGVYNTSGLEVARLYQGRAEGGKEYQATFDRKSLPAGVYVLRLTTEKETKTTKVVIVR